MSNPLTKHVLVLSIDAMTWEDWEDARNLPAFGRLAQEGATVQSVQAVYPSLTYPCHVSMITGCYPERHGVINNEIFQPNSAKRPWVFYANQLQSPTILDYAHKAGISTGSVMWPCVGGAKVDWLLPEIWDNEPNSGFFEPFCRAGTTEFVKEIWPIVGKLENGFKQPMFDNFVTACAQQLLQRKRPQMCYVHLCALDNAKHFAGLHTPQTATALSQTDAHVGHLLDTLEQLNMLKETTVVLCSDHGQVPVTHLSYPNHLLYKEGLFKGPCNYQIISHSSCCSAQIYCRQPELLQKACNFFGDENKQRMLGIETVLTAEQLTQQHHLTGKFSLMLEGASGVLFKDDWQVQGPLLPMQEGEGCYRANHGHLPTKGEQPFFLMAGSGVRPHVHVERATLVDEPATIARLLGFDMEDIDGTVLEALLQLD